MTRDVAEAEPTVLTDALLNQMYSLCLRVTGDRHEAADACQDAALNLLRKQRAQIRNPHAYALKIALNACLKRMKHRSLREECLKEIQAAEGYPLPPLDVVDAERLRASVQSLPLKLRIPILLRYEHGLDYPEIADQLDLTINHVRVLIFRAIREIRAQFRGGRP